MLEDILSRQRQAHIYATGLLAIITLGTLALIGLCIAAIWLLVELVQLLLTVIVETCNSIGQTYTSADPMVKFLLLVAIGFVLYRVGRKVWR